MLRTLLALTPSRGGDTVFEASLVPQKVEKGLKGPPKPHKPTEAGPRAAGRIPVAVGMQDSRVATTWALRPKQLERQAWSRPFWEGGGFPKVG